MTATKLSEIRLPDVTGWEWSEDGVRYQITWGHGTHSLHFSSQHEPGTRWVTTSITRPERFGFDGTLKGARAAAQAFVSQPTDTVEA